MHRYIIYIYIYIDCGECCLECNGTTNKECLAGECDRENSCYPLHGLENECLYACDDPLTPRYLDTTSGIHLSNCKECHENCTMCSGSSSSECFMCKSPVLLTNEHECMFTDCSGFPNTFQTLVKCENCDSRCNGCENSPSYCLDCVPGYLFLTGSHSCLTQCPPQFYGYIDIRLCQSIYIYIYI